jgi:small subunit ribosomal protein S6
VTAMRFYEHTFIARQDLSAQQAQNLAETYAGVVAEQGGEVTKSEYWGLRNLAYRIRKNRKGHYLHFNLNAPAEAIEELERQERLSDDVIRYLTVKVDRLDEKPSILMQVRSTREERSRRSGQDRSGGERGGDQAGDESN